MIRFKYFYQKQKQNINNFIKIRVGQITPGILKLTLRP